MFASRNLSGMYREFRHRSWGPSRLSERASLLTGTSSSRNLRSSWAPWLTTIGSTIASTFSNNPVGSILFIFVPLGLMAPSLTWSASAIFSLNFLSLASLDQIFSYVLMELSNPVEGLLQDLVLGSISELSFLIITALALGRYGAPMVQAMIFGSIIFQNLAVLGCGLMASGARYHERSLDRRWETWMSLITMTLIFPSWLSVAISSRGSSVQSSESELKIFSRAAAPVLLTLYLVFILFQSRTHADHFIVGGPAEEVEPDTEREATIIPHWSSLLVTAVLATAFMGMIAISAKHLVDSLGPLSDNTGISKSFISYILLPLLFNMRSLSLVLVAWKGLPELLIISSISSMIYTLLLGYPLLVIIGWIRNVDVTFHSSPFGVLTASITCLIETGLVLSGSVTYLPGVFCVAGYALFVLALALHADPSVD
ncbi:hypothetical protein BDV11DRAFT_10130 [Aspergillus similis]